MKILRACRFIIAVSSICIIITIPFLFSFWNKNTVEFSIPEKFNSILTTSRGESDSIYRLGRTTIVFFGFTRCRGICPKILNELQNFLEEDHDCSIEVTFISIDPSDTESDLLRFEQIYNYQVRAFHGSIQTIQTMAEILRAPFYLPAPGNIEKAVINHTSRATILREDGRNAILLENPTAKRLHEEITKRNICYATVDEKPRTF
ncbi:SCO family protein [Leptospira sp. SA-E8]|uniref:SCO family protein n=1 Tax=Leptospira sp. SA-E8 TaxID=3422259 RepID=UPI003EB8B188